MLGQMIGTVESNHEAPEVPPVREERAQGRQGPAEPFYTHIHLDPARP
jgi:hypothetical protein